MKVTLPRGIASISGTFCQSRDGRKLVAKTFRRADGTKETRMYWMDKQQRSTPVTAKESANRQRMAQASQFFLNLSPADKERYAQEMKAHKYRFDGKEYSTLRGYVIARFYKNALL